MVRQYLKNISWLNRMYISIKPMYLKIKSDSTQSGELTAIRNLLDENFPPYLVDVGAHDGSSISNSTYFVEQGWNAILIEPLPGPFQILYDKYKNLNNVDCINVACSNQREISKSYLDWISSCSILELL